MDAELAARIRALELIVIGRVEGILPGREVRWATPASTSLATTCAASIGA